MALYSLDELPRILSGGKRRYAYKVRYVHAVPSWTVLYVANVWTYIYTIKVSQQRPQVPATIVPP